MLRNLKRIFLQPISVPALGPRVKPEGDIGWGWGVVFALLFLLLAIPAHAEGVLHRANRAEPVTLDPQKVTTPSEAAIVGDLFEGLLTYDGDGHPVLGMADA